MKFLTLKMGLYCFKSHAHAKKGDKNFTSIISNVTIAILRIIVLFLLTE